MGKKRIDTDKAAKLFRENKSIKKTAKYLGVTSQGLRVAFKRVGIIGNFNKIKKPSTNGHKLILDFTGQEDALEMIREIAATEVRTPEQQAIYLLKNVSGEIIAIKKAARDE